MRRRKFITLFGSAAAAWPLAARAQQGERMRRIGVLMGYAETDPDARARAQAFERMLQGLGWKEGHDVVFDYRWASADAALRRRFATEIVNAKPDVILANTAPVAAALKQLTGTIPIVYASGADLVGSGLVSNLAHPGGNITGFPVTVPSLGGKWLELLKELAPATTRVGAIVDPANPLLMEYQNAVEQVNLKLKLDITHIEVRSGSESTRAIDVFAQASNGALLVLPGASTGVSRQTIIEAAARNRLPAIYPFRFYAVDGGLVSYGADQTDLFRRAASYVDRILRGEKAGDLPVQEPTKFELVINLKTAKALGLEVPPTLLARADEVIE